MTDVIKATITLIAALITAFVIPWLKKKYDLDKLNKFLKYVDMAVLAAQQLLYYATGEERKDYALDFLEAKGYDRNAPETLNALEAAVLKLHQELKETVA